MNEIPAAALKTWPDYRAVWRWHFYASLFCIPFVIVLSISGGIYLFKDEVEAWQDRPYDHLEVHGPPAAAAEQIRAAVAAVPDGGFDGYQLPESATAAAQVLVRQHDHVVRVYVHPETLAVLHTVQEDERLMGIVRKLHGELLAGEYGSMVVELAASWTIIMIVTGLFLWWPRQARGLAGVLYPRFDGGSRMMWRDLHAVTGVWICTFALFMLVSGLPWAKSWGNYLRTVRRLTGTASARQDWTIGGKQVADDRTSGESDQHVGHDHHGGGRRRRGGERLPKDLSAVDRVIAVVRPLDLPPPVVIGPPARGTALWTAKSLTANRPKRVDLTVDGETGDVVTRQDFAGRQLIDQAVAVGIAAHEGRLFGWPNQLLGLLTAAGLDLICVSGLVMWWKRRDHGVLGAPKVVLRPRVSFGLLALVVMFGVYLPLFGTSLIAVSLVERLVLRRIPRVRDWLGLSAPRPAPEG
ncbi:MAG TPA: PepSY domain-containing protein [Planctomycetaceae bacterium]|nr:PepSY domain-containing protein [Planctomycetaceae bacterium]